MSKFYIVENRRNDTLSACMKSSELAGVDIEVVDSTSAGAAYDDFCSSYRHMSVNSPEFEKICFRRYFLLANAVRGRKGRLVLLDSDVLVYPAIRTHVENLGSLNQAFLGSRVSNQSDRLSRISPHFSLWTTESLLDFVDTLSSFYRSEENVQVLRTIYEYQQNQGVRPSISDMTLLYIWSQRRAYTGSSLSILDEKVADHNVNVSDNLMENEFASFGGAKLVKLKGGRAFGQSEGRQVEFVLLHFQGRAKIFMHQCLAGRGIVTQTGLAAVGMARKVRQMIAK